MQLDDIDWEAETLRVRRPKTGRVDLFPLSRRVGETLARYAALPLAERLAVLGAMMAVEAER